MATPLRVLILEDRPADAELMLHELRRAGFEPDWRRVEAEADYLACLRPAPDVILADHSLPQFNAMRALQLLQERELDIPFIVVSGAMGEELAVEILKQGAADYLIKDRLDRLGQAVIRSLEEKRLRVEKQQAQEALRESEERFRTVADFTYDWEYWIGPDGNYLYVSPSCERITGYRADEFLEEPGLLEKIVHPDDRTFVAGHIHEELGVEESLRVEFRIVARSGEERWIEHACQAVHSDSGYRGRRASNRDITQRKRAEERLRATNRLLDVLSDCNQALVRATEESELMKKICRIIVEVGGYRLAWVGFVEQDPAKTVRPVAQWGYEEGYLDTLDITLSDTERGRGPVGTAIRTGKLSVTQHILTDPDFEPWRAEAVGRGYAAAIALPLVTDDQPMGALAIYAEDPHAFDAEEVNLLTELADDLAYGITAIRAREAHEQAEEALRESEEKFRMISASAQDAVLMMDNESKISSWNEAAEKIFGYSGQEAMGKELHIFLAPQRYHDAYRKGFAEFRATGEGVAVGKTLELAAVRKDGTEFPIELSVSRVRLKDKWHATGIIRDITNRKQAEEQILRQTALLDGINRVFREALVCETDEEVAHTCLAVAEDLTGSKFGMIGEVNPVGRFDTLAISNPGWDVCKMPDSEATRLIENMEIRGIDRSVIREGKSRIVNDPASHPDRVGVPEGHPPITCFLGVPLKHAGETIGMIGLANKEAGYDLEDQEDVEALSASFVESLMRKRAEISGQKVRVRLQHVLDSSPDIVYSCSVEPNGNPEEGYAPTFVTANITDIWGYEVEECIGNPKWWPEHIHPDDAPAAFADMQRLFQEGHLVHEYRFKARGGSWRWVRDELVLVRDTEGNPVEFVGSWSDITERRQAEEALRQNEERLENVVECLPEGVCVLDGERRAILANPIAQEYLQILGPVSAGEPISSLGGKPLEDFLAPCPKGHTHEVTVEAPSRRIFEIETNPLGEEGTGVGWVMIIRDVTQAREMQHKIQRQYRLASVGQLAAGIAHDFNNMLTVMMGTAQIMGMRQDVPDALKGELDTIYTQGQRAAQLIRQILDFSRQTVAERKPVDLAPFFRELVRLMGRTLPETIKIVTDFRVRGDAYRVNANLSQLQQVFTNLAVNARDAMPDGGELRMGLSHIRIEPGEPTPFPEMKPGDWVVWRVSDTGAGMPSNVMAHIFEPFFTTKKRGEGTGLGLAQVYGIVSQHDGFVDVESEEGKGTTFSVYLPQITENEEAVERASTDLASGRGRTILVVEDKPEVLKVTRGMLEGLGYEVVTASNGQEALSVYGRRREEIALVLTDMVMPEMGGATLAEALKKRDPEVRIVVMTGYARGEEEGVQLPSGMVGYLDKPLDLQQVAQVVDQALKSKRPNET